jgi:hypothetical protein
MMTLYKQGPNTPPAFNNRVEWQDPVSGMLYYAKSYGKECLFGPSTATDKASCEGTVTAPTGGHWVEKGIAARVLEYANWLTSQGYACDPTYNAVGYSCDPSQPSDPNNSLLGFDPATGRYHFATMKDGTAVVRTDPMIAPINASGNPGIPNPTCDTDYPSSPTTDCDPNVLFPTSTDTLGNVTANPTFCGANKLRAQPTTPACKPLTQYDNHYASMLAAYKEVPDYLWETVIRYGLGNPAQLGLFP